MASIPHRPSLPSDRGSCIAQAGPFAAVALGIASALPHDVAIRVFRELVASVTAVRTQPIGVAMEACLVGQQGPPPPQAPMP